MRSPLIAFIPTDLDPQTDLAHHARRAQHRHIMDAARQSAEHMEDALLGRHDLGLDGMVVLFTAESLLAFELVLGLRDFLLRGVDEHLFDLRIGFQQLF